MTFFWILWGFDAFVGLIVLYFFMIGLNDGSVSSFNMGMWTILLLALAAIMGGSLWLKSLNHIGLAKVLLCLLAIPGLLFGLFMLLMITTNTRWN